eukprot:9500567-Pyramimonas_sp.AAC.3
MGMVEELIYVIDRALLEDLSYDPNSQNEAFALDILRNVKMLEIGRPTSNTAWEGVSPETSSQSGDVGQVVVGRFVLKKRSARLRHHQEMKRISNMVWRSVSPETPSHHWGAGGVVLRRWSSETLTRSLKMYLGS